MNNSQRRTKKNVLQVWPYVLFIIAITFLGLLRGEWGLAAIVFLWVPVIVAAQFLVNALVPDHFATFRAPLWFFAIFLILLLLAELYVVVLSRYPDLLRDLVAD